ncbi:MAG TPA: TrbC/VirB2 family protein [Kribbellaceae bacterium]|jgi:type IV secretory pathway VirB2 component (pilin)|nr:TrbC/VirB2 family protein [Kribbellaceae bacterium]
MFYKFVPLLAPLNNPVAPEPIRQNVEKVVNWVTWIGMMVCILGIIIAGSMMAIGQRRGEGGEHASRLGWVIAGCIVIGAASGIVNAFLA